MMLSFGLIAQSMNESKALVTNAEQEFEKLKVTSKKTIQDINANLVYVEGGTFKMGSDSKASDSDEKPVHKVTLNSFNIMKYEVTQSQWAAIMVSNPSYFKSCEDCPVEQVSFEDCMGFINKLNQLSGKKYRLPTEAEWEYAARGGMNVSHKSYSGSNNIGKVAWYEKNCDKKTHPVGTKQANELGIFDMTGNVWEWCNDWYDAYSSGSQNNPMGNSSGGIRVSRGGSWHTGEHYSRVSSRSDRNPSNRTYVLGFRLVLVP
ncbi:MAG: SUMF1/EgtB/PvdO family nonheme iron enzyme [Sediminibacterium sp.]|nr:SUMF1/EgtB/PvdO family nonheme iron enzyme [Sediminibacterium sp.]